MSGLTVQQKKEKAYLSWKCGTSISITSKETGASRTTVSKWYKEWAKEFSEEVEETVGGRMVRDGIEALHLKNIGKIYEKTLARTEYIERQKKVSDSVVGMIGNALVDIQKEVQQGARYLDFHKELSSLTKTLEVAQRVFNLAAGLATTHLAVDMGLIDKAMSAVPDEALEVWAEPEEDNQESG